jgi:pimeloyl-ACP methyl ester carboxylesterase
MTRIALSRGVGCVWVPLRLMLFVTSLLVVTGPTRAQTPFYDPPKNMLDGQPGTLVRREPIDGAPLGAMAYRVIYRSTGLKNEPIFVSGVIVVPQGDPPPDGRPIVAWAHPTSGVTPRCAPSLAIFLFQQIQGLRSFLERGYIVAATDYPGLGTPGPHPYLVGESEARSVIDVVRAAAALPGSGAGKSFTVWGHSQGGQAALFTGMIVQKYAPELNLLGVAAAAPATKLATLMEDDINTVGGRNITAMTLWSWHRVFGAPIDKIVDARAIPVIDRLARECIEGPFDLAAREKTGKPLEDYFLTGEGLAKTEPWRSLLKENSTGPLPSNIPVFLAQGTDDKIIRPEVTRDYMAELCKANDSVKMIILPNIGHGRAAQASTVDAVDWIAGRFAQTAPPTDCSP